jgi:CheY-like chemotaxis protein
MQPLAIVMYEKLLPGTQLVNRLQDLGYRVQTLAEVEKLTAAAEAAGPMLVIADLGAAPAKVLAAIGHLRRNAGTAHLPVIAFAEEPLTPRQAAADQAGVTLLVSETAILNHLAPCLERALQLD